MKIYGCMQHLAELEKPNLVKGELKKLIAEWPPGLENQKSDSRKVRQMNPTYDVYACNLNIINP